jgi:hypothetical protein
MNNLLETKVTAVEKLVNLVAKEGSEKITHFINGCAYYKKGCSGKQQEFGFAFQDIFEQFIIDNKIQGYQDKGNDDTGDGEYEGESLELKTHHLSKNGDTFYSVNTSEDLLFGDHLPHRTIMKKQQFIASKAIQEISKIGVLVLSYDYQYTIGNFLTIDVPKVLSEIVRISREDIRSRERFYFLDKDNLCVGKLIRPHDSKNQERGLFFNTSKFKVLYETKTKFDKNAIRYVLSLRAEALIRKYEKNQVRIS